jgi:hypothetical protein
MRCTPALAFLIGLSCCGYSTRALLPGSIRTVAILPIENQTLKPGLELQLTDSLARGFQKDGNLRLADPERADLVLRCQVTGFRKDPQTYVSGQEVSTWQVGLSAQCEVKQSSRDAKLWSGGVSVSASYDAVGQTEEQGIEAAVGKLADEIVRRTLLAW